MSAIAATLRSRARPISIRFKLPARRTVVLLLVAALALTALYRFYLRDSGLVAVSNVEIQGIEAGSPGAAELKADIERAAETMTTLHVKPEVLREAAAGHPLVRSISADASFPHTLNVTVIERRPSAIMGTGASAVVIADDGVLLKGMSTDDLELPAMSGLEPPTTGRVKGPALDLAAVLGAAPKALVPHLESAENGRNGVDVTLAGGIELRFGTSAQPGRKWAAAASVLADPELTALDYVDLSSPRRPAVGGAGHTLPTAP